MIFIWYVTSTRAAPHGILVARAGRLRSPETIRCSSLFHPCPRKPLSPSLCTPPFSIPHNERSRNAGGQCSRKADSGIAVWPGTVHRSPSPLHLLHPRERTSPHISHPLARPFPSASYGCFSCTTRNPLYLHLVPSRQPGFSPVGCASIPDLTLLRRRFA